jgi:hypothetical protein
MAEDPNDFDSEVADSLFEIINDEAVSDHHTEPPANLHALTPVAFTPLGQELIFGDECEEPTLVYPRHVIEKLIKEANPHRHGTVRAMLAVVQLIKKAVS